MEKQYVRWNPLYYTSIVMFLAVILSIPFNKTLATLILFSLAGIWSRIPFCLNMYCKDIEIISFFSLIVAINFGGVTAGLFGIITLTLVKIFSYQGQSIHTLKEGTSLFITSLLAPIIYYLPIVGQNLLFAVFGFILTKYFIYYVITLVFDTKYFDLEFAAGLLNIPTAFVANTIIVLLFGNFLNQLVKIGIGFNWTLAAFIGGVIALVGINKELHKHVKRRKQLSEREKQILLAKRKKVK